MMQQQAIVHKLLVNRIGQKISFQVRLPKDAKRVIGLEYNVRKIYGNAFISFFSLQYGQAGDPYFRRQKNKLIGRLTLANRFCEGTFYQGDLIEDRNEIQYEGIAAWGYSAKQWMNGRKQEEVCFNVNAGVIEGMFHDNYGANQYTDLEYELTLYFWVEKCSNDN